MTSLDASSIFGNDKKSNTTLQSSVDELLKSISSVESAAGEYQASHEKHKVRDETHVQTEESLSQGDHMSDVKDDIEKLTEQFRHHEDDKKPEAKSKPESLAQSEKKEAHKEKHSDKKSENKPKETH